ncbi:MULTISPECIES: hypothetical protein [unclassified Nocardioides]|uniref:hypothetical protein n=1 Tax=unclassified Nocardioides TaxID=2615069 RepID=UPI000702C6F4|nr:MULTISPECIES: hypothetical protein [unclassified Nocardioides]KRC48735.1 hypothetical protein ASE19_17535 [Nocardioides sp. Root79]KRC75135.1 hypothetical protein ASE20_19435 [Nocardioides sp. Root240]
MSDAPLTLKHPVTVDRLRLYYALAAARVHLAIDPARNFRGVDDEERLELLRLAATYAGLVAVAGAELEALEGSANDFLGQSLVPAAYVLRAGALLELAWAQRDDDERVAVAATTSWDLVAGMDVSAVSYRVRYNLACYWSSWIDRVIVPPVGTDDRPPTAYPARRALAELRTSLATAPFLAAARLADWAVRDPSLARLRRSSVGELEFVAAVAPYRHG